MTDISLLDRTPDWLVRQLKCSADGRGFVGECLDRWGCNCSVGLYLAAPAPATVSAPSAEDDEDTK